MRRPRFSSGVPVSSSDATAENKAMQDLKNEFLAKFPSWLSSQSDLDHDLHSYLTSFKENLENTGSLEAYDLWIVAHVLNIRIRVSMKQQISNALQARPKPHYMSMLPDGVCGPQDQPISMRLIYSVAFGHAAERILQYDLCWPDPSGTQLMAPDSEVEPMQEPTLQKACVADSVTALVPLATPSAFSDPSSGTQLPGWKTRFCVSGSAKPCHYVEYFPCKYSLFEGICYLCYIWKCHDWFLLVIIYWLLVVIISFCWLLWVIIGLYW